VVPCMLGIEGSLAEGGELMVAGGGEDGGGGGNGKIGRES
jgi:hypothetical protein